MATDYKGRELRPGQLVVRGFRSGNTGGLEERTVERVDGERVFLNDSHVAITRTDCLYIIDDN